MGLTHRLWFRIVNDVVHDLAAGAWPGAVMALWIARSVARGSVPSDVYAVVQRAWSGIPLIMIVALAVLVATGGVRLYYRGFGLPGELLKARGRAALIKHAVFTTVFLVATVIGFAML